MKVNGNQIKQAIKMKGLELDSVSSTFDESLFKFADETKRTPEEIADDILKLETEISKLQAAQKFYNVNVKFDYEERQISLQEAVNLVGGTGRVSKLWRKASKGEKKDRYGYGRDSKTRNKEEEVAEPTITKTEALKLFKDAERKASALRNGIAEANTIPVEIDFIDESLFN